MHQLPQVHKAYISIALNMGLSNISDGLKGTGVSEEALNEAEVLSLPSVVKMVRNVEAHSTLSHWPTLLGSQLGATSHGSVGFATLSAPNVGEAIQTFMRWFKVRCDAYHADITLDEQGYRVVVTDTSGDAVFERVFFDALSRAMEVLVQLIIGPFSHYAMTLHFKTDPGTDQKKENFYLSDCVYSQPQNEIRVPKALWLRESPLHDPDVFQLNLKKCQQLLDQYSEKEFLDLRVRQLLQNHFELLNTDFPTYQPIPSQTDVCRVLQVNERTLIRRLKSLNTSYKQIAADTRHTFAKKVLQKTSMSVAQLADMLGYSDHANFCRAFKSWEGLSPLKYRESTET